MTALLAEAAGLSPLTLVPAAVGVLGVLLHLVWPLPQEGPEEALLAASLML